MLNAPRDLPGSRERRAAAAAAAGALLTLLVVAASALVRLETRFDGTDAVTTLAPGLEAAVRTTHRLAAMAAGLAAAICVVIVSRLAPDARRIGVSAAVVALVLALATVGRYAPGYAHDGIVVFHVVAGTLLACAFWALRVLVRARATRLARTPLMALAAVVAASAIGAASAAASMHGPRSFGSLHLALAAGALGLAAIVAWQRRSRAALAGGIAALLLLQGAGGLAQLRLGVASAAWLGVVHAVGSVTLATMLVAASEAVE